MIGNARGSHTSPGIYTKEIDLTYASKSLGITTLGAAGETLKGPAFEPIKIENWREFVDYFGGTSTEEFVGSKYPKYELPYIAKQYLKNSNQLEVCRVLGLSGYNAGPAWLITVKKTGEDKEYVVAVLRSRGKYTTASGEGAECNDDASFDKLTYVTDKIVIEPYTSASIKLGTCGGFDENKMKISNYEIDSENYGRFNLKAVKSDGTESKSYSVSLNSFDENYIINVLGTNPMTNETVPFFVEELYDVALGNMLKNASSGDTFEIAVSTGNTKELKKIVEKEINAISVDKLFTSGTSVTGYTVANLGETYFDETTCAVYKVEKVTGTTEDGSGSTVNYNINTAVTSANTVTSGEVYVASVNDYYTVNNSGATIITLEVNDYKEQFRCASTPWFVSELKGEGEAVEVKKLFRFHTISDGNCANHEVKVSIQNIRPDEGLFDVVIRKFDDLDSTPVILERYTKCNMVPGTSNFIGYKIGTFDGEYVVKSKYVTVEVIMNEVTETCVPAGFLGYPVRNFGTGYIKLDMGYNVKVSDIKPKKQYFGFSNLMGIDVDLFKYKGRFAYDDIDSLSNGFHLDSRINQTYTKVTGTTTGATGTSEMSITVDGVSDFEFACPEGKAYFGNESRMEEGIYKDINLRKFTACFYGGFDGWDIYRTERTNSDKYKANKYNGKIGQNFTQINDPQGLELSGNCITSDYYAYLAAARQFCNKEAVDINLFVTPGIDYVNQTLLSQEILDMVEEERGDVLYVMTTPGYPSGAKNEMYYADEVVANLESAEIDSNYAATYYPWVKYFDADNKKYINLPATKDAVSAMAYTDNVSYPWFAPAGTVRGAVECERAAFITKLEDEDALYEGMINPIKTFAVDGVKIWGQKTMYSADTPLNRINVRRLMLRMKKLIEGACRRLIFEQNDVTVKSQFEGLVKPILDDIKAKRGIYDYRLEVNDSAEARDRLELPAVIYIKPTKALEYIDLSFVIMPESVAFNE